MGCGRKGHWIKDLLAFIRAMDLKMDAKRREEQDTRNIGGIRGGLTNK